MEPNFEITLPCLDCDGTSLFSTMHPLDPSGQDKDCIYCEGTGEAPSFLESYDCLEDAKADYPDGKIRAL